MVSSVGRRGRMGLPSWLALLRRLFRKITPSIQRIKKLIQPTTPPMIAGVVLFEVLWLDDPSDVSVATGLVLCNTLWLDDSSVLVIPGVILVIPGIGLVIFGVVVFDELWSDDATVLESEDEDGAPVLPVAVVM